MNTHQTLTGTRCEHPLSEDDVAELVDRLDNSVLSRRQAEVLVLDHGRQMGTAEIADELGVSEGRVHNLRRELRQKLDDVDAVLAAVADLRDNVRPEATPE